MSILKIFNTKKIKPHIFLHLHKCGGTTLMKSIDINYNAKNIYAIDGRNYRNSYTDFKQLKSEKRKKIDLLRGHHFFGSHVYLREEAKYFTMLREPMSRLASLYNYLREIDLYKDINNKKMSIAEFLDSGLVMAADNGMSRMLTNHDFENTPNGQIPLKLADEAIKNIDEYFVAIGLMEEFDKSLEVFKTKLNWSKTPENSAKNRTNTKLVSKDDMIRFFEQNNDYKKYIQVDLLVYKHAKLIFENY